MKPATDPNRQPQTEPTATGPGAADEAAAAAEARPAAASVEGAPSTGESWVTTRFDALEDWAQRHSFWPFPFGTACCAIEFMSTVSSHYDMSRFGSEVVRFSPRQSDVLIVAGTINDKMGPVLKTIYDQMADPKWVISMGACACSGGFYRAYHVMQGIDEIIPVDVYVPGCPPSPEGLMYGLLQLKEKVIRDRAKLRQAARAGESEGAGEGAGGARP